MFIVVLLLLVLAFAEVPESGKESVCEGKLDEYVCFMSEAIVFDTIEEFAPSVRYFVEDALRSLNDASAETAKKWVENTGLKLVNDAAEFVRRMVQSTATMKKYFPERYETMKPEVMRVVDDILTLASSPQVKRCMIGTVLNVTRILQGE